MDDGSANLVVVTFDYATLPEERAQIRPGLELRHRSTAVSIAPAVVRPGDIVQVDGRPQPRRFLRPTGRRDQTKCATIRTTIFA